MKAWKALFLFGLVLTSQYCLINAEEAAEEASDAEDYADEERAFLVVRKWFKEEQAVQGRNLTLYIELYNAGNAAASSVSVTDAGVPKGFSVLEGATTAAFAKIDVGSKANFSYTVAVTTAEAVVAFEPAKVTYKADADGEEQATQSTPAYIEVLTPNQQLQKHALNVGKYVSLGMMRTAGDWIVAAAVLGVLAVVLGGNSAYKSASAARTSMRRKQALASLEKDE